MLSSGWDDIRSFISKQERNHPKRQSRFCAAQVLLLLLLRATRYASKHTQTRHMTKIIKMIGTTQS